VLKREGVTVRLTAYDLERLRAAAEAEGISMSAVGRRLIRESLAGRIPGTARPTPQRNAHASTA
jgi:hypothetical protein